MEKFQHGQQRPESTKRSSDQPNDVQRDRATANQTTQQSASGNAGNEACIDAFNDAGDAAGGANKSTVTNTGSHSDQSNGKRPGAAINQTSQAQIPQEQNPQEQNSQAQNSQAQATQAASQSAISQAALGKRLGAKFVVPGESGNQYYLGLASTIEALGAKSQMEVYLAEKIFTCIWSMNRYEIQKRESLIAEMVKALQDGFSQRSDTKLVLTQLLEAGRWDEPDIKQVMQTKGFTQSSLTQRAMERRMEEIMQLDQAISVKAHTLKALQKSYESFACRSILQERLKLQNELLKRDLQAIDVPVLKASSRGVEAGKETAQARVRQSKVVFSKSDLDNESWQEDGLSDNRIVDVNRKVDVRNDANSSRFKSNGSKSNGTQTKAIKTKAIKTQGAESKGLQRPKPSDSVNNRDSL